MAAQADILAQIAGGLGSSTPKYGDVQKNQLSLDETRAKSNDLKIAEANRVKQAKDIKLLNDSFTSSGGDLKATRNQYIKMGGGIPVLMQWEESNAKTRKLIGETDEQMAKAAALKATNLSQMLTGYSALPPDQQEQVRPQVEAQLRQDGHLGPTESLDGNKAALLIAQGRSFADMTGRIHADADAKQAAANAANVTDEMTQRQATRPSIVKKAEADAITAAAAAAAAPELQNAAILKANADALKVQQETEGTTPISPEQQVQLDQAKAVLAQTAARDAAANANAQANTRVAQGRLNEEIRYHQQENADMVDSGIANVPKNLRAPATAAALKVATAASDAQQAADDMQTFIDLARSGNKVAYAYAPVEGVLTLNTGRGVKRVNMAEIQGYAGAGSTVDKVQGWLGGHIAGESIPPQILDAMESLHKSVASNAKVAAQRKLDDVNGLYHSDFKLPGATSGAKRKVGDIVTIQGKQKVITVLHADGSFDAKDK